MLIKTSAQKLNQFPRNLAKSIGYSGKWLKLETIRLENNDRYDVITRTTGAKYYSGVNLFAMKTYKDSLKFLLISNFRIPAQELILEIPSGLCLKGQTVKENALTELKEETGYQNMDFIDDSTFGKCYGDIQRSNEHAFYSLGFIDEVKYFLNYFEVNFSIQSEEPEKLELEDEEYIEVIEFPDSDSIVDDLNTYCHENNIQMVSNLGCIFYGYQMYREMKNNEKSTV